MKRFKHFTEELQKVGSQLGSNPGGVHVDTETGEKHYVKFYKNADQAKIEALTANIYNHMGIKTLNPETRMVNGKQAVVTKWNDKVNPIQPHEYEKLPPDQQNTIGKMYHAAILTKNWDIVGLEHDNIGRHQDTGELHALDTGGAFHFRAQGGPKEYGPDVAERESLVGRPGEPSTHVFSTVFKQNPSARERGLQAVRNIDMNHIKGLFDNSGLSNSDQLYSNFAERRNKLLGD